MSRLYDTIEPSVIDEEMLNKAVEEQGPKEEAGRIARQEGINFADVLSLRLDFKNILKIDNLWCFTSLTKLQLDNNIIEKIEGLEMLVNLVWLDLSFNNIEVIEGLETLTKLEDLTLYHNRISRLENMDNLKNLHVFSIGKNNLKELENLKYLRRFKELKTLNLSGNPICDQESYKAYALAYLQQLEYLDYRMIEQTAQEAAKEKYYIGLEELKHDEASAERKAEEARQEQAELESHKEAYVEYLNTAALFDMMYADDTEGQKLNQMPGVDELIIVFKEKFVNICQCIFELGLEEHKKRKKEVEEFWECIGDAKTENKQMGTKLIDEFQEYKKRLWIELQHLTDPALQEEQTKEYTDKVNTLSDKLMGFELQLVEQLEDVIKDFERQIADMNSLFFEKVQGQMSHLRDLENQHNERMMEMAIAALEKVGKNELEEDISDELRQLFVDKDTIINAVQASHDLHLLKIDNREDEIQQRMKSFENDLTKKIHDEEEVFRNRQRVREINNLHDHLNDEIENFDFQG